MVSHKFLGFVELLKESVSALPKNGKVMAFITTLSSLLYSLFNFLTIFAITPLIFNLALKQTNPSFPNHPDDASDPTNLIVGFMENMGTLFGVELVFSLFYFFISFFTAIATIFISATSYSKEDLSLKNLVLRVAGSWIKPLVTMFYVKLVTIGYMSVCFMVIPIPFSMISDHPEASKSIIIVVGIFATAFYLYISVFLMLGLVISVIEENCYGFEALGKAGQLVKGKKLDGFMLNFLLALFSGIVFVYVYWIFKGGLKRELSRMLMVLFLIFTSSLITMFQFMAYTVLYFKCKKYHGEEVELQGGGGIKYSKLPTAALHNEYIP